MNILHRMREQLRRVGAFSKERELSRLRHLPRRAPAVTTLFGKPFYVVDGASFVSAYKEIFGNGIYAFRAASRSPYIIDCGANVGVSVMYFKEQYPDAEMTAFEPDPAIFKTLEKNVSVQKLRNVALVNKAVWDADAVLSFASDGADGGRVSEKAGVPVEAVRLAPFLNRPVDFLKIDIEGAEDVVLKDSEPHLKNVKNMFVEYHSRTDSPQQLADILGILTRAGFRYHLQSATEKQKMPFVSRTSKDGFDNQLNIFAYRS